MNCSVLETTHMSEIFIFVAGGSPQIITETIQALAIQVPSILPDELHIITTSEGKRIIKKALLDEGRLSRLFAEFGFPPVTFNDASFYVPTGMDGQELSDLRTTGDNEIMGDLITEFIREQADRTGVRLHCSLAGGRKTMSFYLGAALELFGRTQDKLYHVHISPEFEGTNFYYRPKQNEKILRTYDKAELNTDDAAVFLSELPFIRMRDKLPLKGVAGQSFSALVREGQIALDTAPQQPKVRVNLKEDRFLIGETPIELTATQLAIYTAFLKLKLDSCVFAQRPYCKDEQGVACTSCFQNLDALLQPERVAELADNYAVIHTRKEPVEARQVMELRGEKNKMAAWLDDGKDGFCRRNLRTHTTKINRALQEQLNDVTLASQFTIQSAQGRWSHFSGYGIRVDKNNIVIE